MAHGSMYQLQYELINIVNDLSNRAHYHESEAHRLDSLRAYKQSQLDKLNEGIQRANEYEAEQREKSE